MSDKNSSFYYIKLWDEIHTKAAKVKNLDEQKEYCVWIRKICTTLHCITCRHHGLLYIKNNPPEKETNIFMWTWKFHNTINEILRKPIVNYETAAIRYLD